MAPLTVNQRLPSGPTVRLPGSLSLVLVGIGNSLMAPVAGSIFPMKLFASLFPEDARNQRSPSGPGMMSLAVSTPPGRPKVRMAMVVGLTYPSSGVLRRSRSP